MSFEVLISDRAEREYQRLLKKMQQRLAEALLSLEDAPLPPKANIKKLQGFDRLYRLRVGEYRIIYRVENKCVSVERICTRQDAY